MTVSLRGVTAPTSVSAYHEVEYVDGVAVQTGNITFGPIPVGITIGPKEAARLAAYLLGQPVPAWEAED